METETEQAAPGRSFCLKWALGNSATIGVGLFLGLGLIFWAVPLFVFRVLLAFPSLAGSPFEDVMCPVSVVNLVIAHVVLGAAIGIVQSRCLRRWIRHAGWWGLIAALGSGVSLYLALESFYREPAGLGVGVVLAGCAVGIGQWLVLRRQRARSGWWVLVSTVGFGLFYLVFRLIEYPVYDVLEATVFRNLQGGGGSMNPLAFAQMMVGLPVVGAISGLVYGAVTGMGLVQIGYSGDVDS